MLREACDEWTAYRMLSSEVCVDLHVCSPRVSVNEQVGKAAVVPARGDSRGHTQY
jgi:hypothetical protein